MGYCISYKQQKVDCHKVLNLEKKQLYGQKHLFKDKEITQVHFSIEGIFLIMLYENFIQATINVSLYILL